MKFLGPRVLCARQQVMWSLSFLNEISDIIDTEASAHKVFWQTHLFFLPSPPADDLI